MQSFRYTRSTPHLTAVTTLAVFPSLTHVYIDVYHAVHVQLHQLTSVMSLRLILDCLRSTRGPAARTRLAAMPALAVQTLCVLGAMRQPSQRKRLRAVLSRTPHIRQLAITPAQDWHQKPRKIDMLTAMHSFTHITYLQLDGALFPHDWRYLLTLASPPAFAASLRQLLLRCHIQNKKVAAALLHSLPTMSPALTHCFVGLEHDTTTEFSAWPPAERAHEDWMAALPSLRAALGPVWCDSEVEVVAWREDVSWRRNMNAQLG